MKRFLMACLGMVLLGIAGLLILHQTIDTPAPVRAQPEGVAVGFPAAPRRPAEVGQYKELVAPLLATLADSDGGVRQLAAATLVKIGVDAVLPLVEALKSKNKDTRANAAYVLGQMGDLSQNALPALATALKDEDREVRRRAAYAIHVIISRNEAGGIGAAMAAATGGMPAMPPMPGGASGMAMPTGAAPMTGAASPYDPGLLLPPMVMPKPEKPKSP